MGTYKVIQDIEAEDKLLGPLTLRQFIYAIIVVALGFVAFRLLLVNWLLALPFLPPIAFFALLAAPFGHEQPNEVWLLAKIRFFLKPRKRIWDQSGIKQLVTITVPKTEDKQLTKNLTQTEVKSRLEALAATIDSRGWAVKNVNVNMFAQPAYANATTGSDRLISTMTGPQDVAITDVQASDDMLDADNNPRAQRLEQMMAQSSQARRQQIVAQMKGEQPAQAPTQAPPQTQPDYWFMNQKAHPDTQPQPTSNHPIDEQALLDKLQESKNKGDAAYGRMRTIKPLSDQPDEATATEPKTEEPSHGSQTPNPVILELASNDDLNVATIARQANKAQKKEPPEDEVVVSLR